MFGIPLLLARSNYGLNWLMANDWRKNTYKEDGYPVESYQPNGWRFLGALFIFGISAAIIYGYFYMWVVVRAYYVELKQGLKVDKDPKVDIEMSASVVTTKE